MARKKFKIKGAKKFMKNLNKEVEGIQGRTLKGMINAIIVLQREAYGGVPIDTSNLAHSWFSVSYNAAGNLTPFRETFKGPDASKLRSQHSKIISQAGLVAKQLGSRSQPVAVFGYTANYAPYVHENVDLKFKRPGGQARWLYKAMQISRAEMLEEIRKYAKI